MAETTIGNGGMSVVELDTLAQSIGRGLSRDFPGVDAEDIAQEILLNVLKSPGLFDRVTDSTARRKVLRNIGFRYALGERHAYIINTGQYIYTPSEVRGLLEVFFLDRSDLNPPTREVPAVRVEAGGIVVALWDMDYAWSQVTDDERTTLARRYRDGVKPDNASTERKAVDRAIDSLTRWLNIKVSSQGNRNHDGPGARSSMTNAAAQSITGKGYNG